MGPVDALVARNVSHTAFVLQALYNHAKCGGGMAKMNYRADHIMCIAEAEEIVCDCWNARVERLYFDYLYGRVLKVDVAAPTVELHLYNRDNGHKAGQRALDCKGCEKCDPHHTAGS